jgi:chromosome segregation ATPase
VVEVEAANVALQEQLAGTCFELDEVHATLAQVLERESTAAEDHAGKTAASRAHIAELESKLAERQAVEQAARACVLELEAALKLNSESLSALGSELEYFKAAKMELERSHAAQCEASSHEIESLKLQLGDSEILKISAGDELVTARSEVEILMKARNEASAEADALKLQLNHAQSKLAALVERLSLSKADAGVCARAFVRACARLRACVLIQILRRKRPRITQRLQRARGRGASQRA